MTEILSSILGRKKPKAPVPTPRPASAASPTNHFSEATSNGFVVINGTNVPQASGYHSESNNQPPKPNDDYESLFSYLRVSPSNPAMNGTQNGSQPVRPAPPVPNESSLPYPLHRTWETRTETTTIATMNSTTVTTEQSTTAHYYLTGIPFQVSKSLGGAAALFGGLNEGLNIKSPNLGDYEYSFALEMEIVQESCPKSP